MENYTVTLGSVACTTGHKEEKSAYDKLMEEVLQIHDGAMLKRQHINNLKTDLSVKVATAKGPARSMAIEKLDRADEAMMAWMHDFSQKFGAGIAHEQPTAHEHTEIVLRKTIPTFFYKRKKKRWLRCSNR